MDQAGFRSGNPIAGGYLMLVVLVRLNVGHRLLDKSREIVMMDEKSSGEQT